jgi:hypothetical protein
MKFCGEISYESENGAGIHSDICWRCDKRNTLPDSPVSNEHREFLHAALDEWLNKSKGKGGFWIGDPEHFLGWGG